MKGIGTGIRSRLAVAALVILFAGVAWAVFHLWPAEVFNYDLIIDLRNAQALVESGRLPVHGSVSSFGAFNPPGVAYGLAPGLLLAPREPQLAMRLMTICLSALTVAGIFFLLRSRFGTGIAVAAALAYLLSSTGWYFMDSMRPRAHPVFLVWALFFLDRWAVERRTWAVFPLLLLLSAGLYWMLEIAPLLLAAALVAVLFRPPLSWRWLAAGAVPAVLLWYPWLEFQHQRDFRDLKVLMFEQRPAHNFARLFHQQLRAKGLERTMGFRRHAVPGLEAPSIPEPGQAAQPAGETETPGWIRSAVQSLPKTVPALPAPVAAHGLLVLTAAGFLLPFGDRLRRIGLHRTPAVRSFQVWLTVLASCWLPVFILSAGDPSHVIERRFLWLWALQGPVLVVTLQGWCAWACRRARLQEGLVTLACAMLLAGLAFHPAALEKSRSAVALRLGLAPRSEFHQVIDLAAAEIRARHLPPRIGYDIPFLAWLVAVREIDGQSAIGLQYDTVLWFRHGIRNLNTDPFSVSPEDTIRIVEHRSAQPWRQSYLDLSGYPPMQVLAEFTDYTVLINPAHTAAPPPRQP